MAVIPKKVGQSNEYELLYQILKKLDAILTGSIKVTVTNPIDNPVKVDQV